MAGINPELRFETGQIPLRANGAWVAGHAVVASTDNPAGEQRGAPGAAVSQHATFTSIEKFLGVAQDDVIDGAMGSLIVKGRTRVIGGGVITAGDYVIWSAAGKFTSYTHDATKFAFVAGIAATDCSGDGVGFDLFIEPMLIGPASASSVNMTLSGTLTAEQVTSTDDMTVTDDLAVGGLMTVGETLGVTGATTLAAVSATTGAFSGNVTHSGRNIEKQGADVASANDMVLGSDGNTFEITGTTQINHISNLTWQNGAEINLIFTSTPTVKASQATSGTNIMIMLAAGADFVASANDMLTLVLCEIGGTQLWREKCRSVNA